MHFQACIKFVSLLLLTLFLTCIQSNPIENNYVLAENSVDRAKTPLDLSNLSSSDKTDLQQGKVVLKGARGDYLGQVIAKGDLDTAWQVLTDYNNFDKFLPNIASSQIISESGDSLIFEQVNIVDLWLFQQKFTVEIEAKKLKPYFVDFKIVKGDLQKLVGKWQLEVQSESEILVSHQVEVEPAGDIEKPFFYGIYESSLEETLRAIAQEIDRRSQKY